jgi:hypothetical protein
MQKIRLTEFEINVIKETFAQIFSGDRLWIFGSRADPTQKGGDIDLYAETHLSDIDIIFDKKIEFLHKVKDQIGEQRIDFVIKYKEPDLPIHRIARETGIKII